MLALKIETVSPTLGWLLFIHAMVDHGLTQAELDSAYPDVAVLGSRPWRLGDGLNNAGFDQNGR